MTYCKLFLCLALLVLIAADTVKQGLPQDQQRVMSYRRIIAQRNLKTIEAHNRNPASTFQMYPYPAFVGLTDSQFKEKHLSKAKVFVHNGKTYSTVLTPTIKANAKKGLRGFVGKDIDLRTKVLTPVKNEGICISGYAISALDCIDMVNIILRKGLPILSWQHLVDCSVGYGANLGCSGGLLMESMDFAQNRGVYSQRAYPIYSDQLGAEGSCKRLPNSSPKYKIKSYSYFNNLPQDADCLSRYRALEKSRPVAVGITGGSFEFSFYAGGILPDCGDYTKLDHMVVLVGAKLNEGANSHWIIKNSWGVGWGEEGYARISSEGSACYLCVDGIYTNG